MRDKSKRTSKFNSNVSELICLSGDNLFRFYPIQMSEIHQQYLGHKWWEWILRDMLENINPGVGDDHWEVEKHSPFECWGWTWGGMLGSILSVASKNISQPTTNAILKMYSENCLRLGFSFNTKWQRKLWRSRSSFRVTMRNLNWQLTSVRHKSRKVLLSKSLNAPPLHTIRLNFSTFSKPLMWANYNKRSVRQSGYHSSGSEHLSIKQNAK